MKFIKTEENDQLSALRKELYFTLTTALDSMWESLYIANSAAYLISMKGKTIGYCCIDASTCLTQLFLQKAHIHHMQKAISALIEQQLITTAMLSSIEPIGFNACLAISTSVEKNTCCYQFSNHSKIKPLDIVLQMAKTGDIDPVKSFYKTQVGFDDTFGYTENLINKKELFLVKHNEVCIGTGECRLSESQPNFADVGVAVHSDYRRKGYASTILHQLALKAMAYHRAPICSTTIDNIASQKAIERAGFFQSHFIFSLKF